MRFEASDCKSAFGGCSCDLRKVVELSTLKANLFQDASMYYFLHGEIYCGKNTYTNTIAFVNHSKAKSFKLNLFCNDMGIYHKQLLM